DSAALFARYVRDRDPRVRDTLFARHLPLARRLARRYGAGTDLEDLEQVAGLGLLKAIDRFRPGGPPFVSFALPTIRGGLRRPLRDQAWPVHVPRDLQERVLALNHLVDTLTGELGRTPTAAELGDMVGASAEQVVEALACASARWPVSLDGPGPSGE